MNYFTIKDIENISGIKAHTLRIWEKRYNIINPKRRESKHRFYDNDDLKNILRITHLYNHGHKISAIANMKQAELNAFQTTNKNSDFGLMKILIEATLDLNENVFNDALENSVATLGLENCMLKVIYPYFEKIGMLWLNNEALPAQERFASNIILKRIVFEIDKLELTTNNNNNAVVLFTPPHEHHEIPLLFMHYLLKKAKRHVYYLGTNITVDTLRAFLEHNNAGTLYFHNITNLTTEKIDEYIQQLSDNFNSYAIVMSGNLTRSVSSRLNNVQLLYSTQHMIDFCKNQPDCVN